MKHFVTVICCLLTAFGVSFAQNFEDYTVEIQDSVEYDYYEKAYEVLEHLNLSEVTSHVLYERGFPFVKMDPFKGNNSDTARSNLITFSLAYASLYSMALDTQARLPEPLAYTQRIDSLHSKSDTVPLMFLHVNFHRFKSYALDSNLVTLSGGQFYDVSNRPESPYQQDSLFLVALGKEQIRTSGALTIEYDTDLWFSNTGKVIHHVAVDFGSGYYDLDIGRTYTHIFDSSGTYPFEVRVTYQDSSVFYSKSYVQVKLENQQRNTTFYPSYS